MSSCPPASRIEQFLLYSSPKKFTFLQVPVNSIVVFTVINAAMALVFDLEALVEFLSIGTLMAYSFVSACVIILRHQPAPIDGNQEKMDCGLDFPKISLKTVF